MKKLFVLLLTLISTITLIAPVYAQSPIDSAGMAQTEMIAQDYYPYPSKQTSINFFGQDQYYSVTFRGNGEAVVNLRTVLSNLGNDRINKIELKIPKVSPIDVFAYQVIREKTCIQYDYSTSDSVMMKESTESRAADPEKTLMKPSTPRCLQYQEPQYYEYTYGNNRYFKADVVVEGDTIHITLPKSIAPETTGSYILYYRARGYATKSLLGGFDYEFETLKVQDKVHTMQVGVNVDSELLLKDAQSQVNYRMSESPAAYGTMSMDSGAGIKMAQFDNYYQQIGQGSLVKTSTDLQPLDSYTVKGRYAGSRIQLYSKEISYGLFGFVAILAVMIFATRFIYKKLHQPSATKSTTLKSGGSLVNILLIGGTSFVSSILILGYTVAVYLLVTFMNAQYYYYQFNFLLMVFTLVVSVAVYGLFLFAPAVYIGIKRSFWTGLATCAATIFWLMFYLLVAILIMFLFRTSQSYPMPIPLGTSVRAVESTMEK